MSIIWKYSQRPGSFTRDIESHAGVCLAMSYYVGKRYLADMQITPAVLNRSMHRFLSMQRAHNMSFRQTSAIELVKMLARGDNLFAKSRNNCTVRDVESEALIKMEELSINRGAIFVNMSFKGPGHGVVVLVDRSQLEFLIFDPNIGMINTMDNDPDTFDKFFASYKNIKQIDLVRMSGTPRDIRSMSSD